MAAFDPTLMHLISTVAGALVAAVWQGAVLTACTVVCLKLLPGITAAARSRVWAGVFLIVMLLPLGSIVHFETDFAPPAKSQLHIGLEWAVVLVGIWALLSLHRVVLLLRSVYLLRGIAMRATPIAAGDDTALLLVLPSRSSFHRTVQLCCSDEVDVPSVVGFFSPRILLPPILLEKMSPSDLRQIVLHEMEHLRRNDDWTNLMQKLGLVLFPLNLVLFWVESRLCVERELACDDGVLRFTGASKAYATCLANLAEQSLLHRGVTLALGAWQRQSELARRVHHILSTQGREMMKPRWAALSAGLALAAVLVSAIALTRTPQLITFGGSLPVQVGMTSTANPILMGERRTWTRPHPTLVNAIMPEHRTRKILTRGKRATKGRWGNAQETRRSSKARPRLLLTRWQDTNAGGRLTLAVYEDSQFTYAAVPVRNGWLIVQL